MEILGALHLEDFMKKVEVVERHDTRLGAQHSRHKADIWVAHYEDTSF